MKDGFWQKLLLLGIGIVLTAGIGGFATYYFQNRSWNNQYNVELCQLKTEVATKIFEDVSKLTSKRLYRMRKLNWSLEENTDRNKIDLQMDLYREVLYEWNDNLKRNEALIKIYFGESIRSYFFDDLHDTTKSVGKMLEDYFYRPNYKRNKSIANEIDGKLWDLDNKAYQLNLDMLKMIQNKDSGVCNIKNN